MTPQEFISNWQDVTLTEQSAYTQHFIDLCALLGQPKPVDVDKDGSWYTFQRGVEKNDGRKGWADVWKKGHFGWEYKGKHKDLVKAYQQLLKYRESLDNPPLLVVCDMDRFEIHTNFTGTTKTVHKFDLSGLAEPQNLDVLRKLFTDPESLKPGETTAEITQRAAQEFARLSDGMRDRGIEPHRAAHFLMKLMFCMFAEDIELLRGEQPGEKLFTQVLTRSRNDPARLAKSLTDLFDAMCEGGDFWGIDIPYFNGGLFKDAEVVELTPAEIRILSRVNDFDWSNVEPSIFGTLFERTLDPAKRSQIGAHYTSRDDIETLLEPVMMAPLRREWAEVRKQADLQWEKVRKTVARAPKAGTKRKRTTEYKVFTELRVLIQDYLDRLSHVRVLDPACGSGNFLYVSLHLLLSLEKEVISYASQIGLGLFPQVRPTQLSGIEINPYAQELAQVVIWIGFLQWMHHNGFQPPRNPVLEPFESIQNKDAILDIESDPEHPTEPEWPEADFIVGNPPFGGSRKMRGFFEDDDSYVDLLHSFYQGRPGKNADFCCYWFERGREYLKTHPDTRIGLIATQAIRKGVSQPTLTRIKDEGDIFFGISDRDWIQDDTAVHVSLVGFDAGHESLRMLDGKVVPAIYADLTAFVDVTKAATLKSNKDIAHQGDTPMGPFEIPESLAHELLSVGGNPNGFPNSDVIVRWADVDSLVQSRAEQWTIDFGHKVSEDTASKYHRPFEWVRSEVIPSREEGRTKEALDTYWLHWRARPKLRRLIRELPVPRYFAISRHSKHLIFIWIDATWLPTDATVAFSRCDDYLFGVVHSRIHEIWAKRKRSQVRDADSGFRYTHTKCFMTFPLPEPSDSQREAIAEAARELDGLRSNWLNPTEWTREEVLEFPGSVDGPWSRYVTDPDERGIGTVRYPRLVAKDEATATKLKKRTLTNLYNERPTWLDLAHKKLDAAVFAAYGWNPEISDDELLANLLALNLERAAAERNS
ncbi:MAG: class I SAM-dependent DNA methyltransferase [Rhodopirellula sp.]|nr:class I SAM-dependent DNA methyltransferase [Rhodopirellula sp.]